MVNIAKLTKKRLGELLMEEGLVTEDQVNEALKQQAGTGELLGEVLTKLGYVTEADIVRTLAAQFGLPYLDVTKYQIPKEVQGVIPLSVLQEHQLVPFDKIGNILLIAVSGVINPQVYETLEQQTGCRIFLYVSTATQVQRVLQVFGKEETKKP